MQGAFLAMSLYPEAQRKAQEELDRIVGRGRLPDFGDLDSLVYINAVVKESLRWHNVVPLGIPHKTIHDDFFRGYFVPAGSVVVSNIWSVLSFGRYLLNKLISTSGHACTILRCSRIQMSSVRTDSFATAG